MNDIIIKQPDPAEHEQSGSLLVQEAQAAVIENNDDRTLAASVVANLNEEIKAILLEFDGTKEAPGPTRLADAAHGSLVALRDRATASRRAAKEAWMDKIKKFEYDVEQTRLAEQKKAEEKAKAKAEEDRKKAIAEAKKAGDSEMVKELKEAPLPINIAPVKTPEVAKGGGVRRSAPEWGWTLLDANKIPDDLWILNEKEIDRRVKAMGTTCAIPGISVHDKRASL